MEIDKPRPMSPDEAELLKKYRELAMPAARLAAFDEFAKWLFTSITVIGSLGVAFSTSAVKALSYAGSWCYFVAILLTGLSLAFAVWLRAIEPQNVNYNNLEVMLRADEAVLRTKEKLAKCSGVAFAVALLFAGSAPLVSLCKPSTAGTLSYAIGKDGIKASAMLFAPASTTVGIRILDTAKAAIAAQRSVVGRDGSAQLEASASVPAGAKSLSIIVTCNAKTNSEQNFTVAVDSGTPAASPTTSGLSCVQ